MILINARCNSKSYSPATNLGGDFAKFSSEVGYNISKAKGSQSYNEARESLSCKSYLVYN